MTRYLETTPWTRAQIPDEDQATIRAWAMERGLRVNVGKSFRGWTCRIYPSAFGAQPLAESFGAPDALTAYLRASKAL